MASRVPTAFQDLCWQPDFQAEHLWEILQLIDREHLQVDRVMGDYRPPEEWSVVSKGIPNGVSSALSDQAQPARYSTQFANR
jgi:hypothetical protein